MGPFDDIETLATSVLALSSSLMLSDSRQPMIHHRHGLYEIWSITAMACDEGLAVYSWAVCGYRKLQVWSNNYLFFRLLVNSPPWHIGGVSDTHIGVSPHHQFHGECVSCVVLLCCSCS